MAQIARKLVNCDLGHSLFMDKGRIRFFFVSGDKTRLLQSPSGKIYYFLIYIYFLFYYVNYLQLLRFLKFSQKIFMNSHIVREIFDLRTMPAKFFDTKLCLQNLSQLEAKKGLNRKFG